MFTYTTVTDLMWTDAEHSSITCMVKFDQFAEAVPFGANPNDMYDHTKEIYARAVAGDFGAIAEYIPPPPPPPAPVEEQPITTGTEEL